MTQQKTLMTADEFFDSAAITTDGLNWWTASGGNGPGKRKNMEP